MRPDAISHDAATHLSRGSWGIDVSCMRAHYFPSPLLIQHKLKLVQLMRGCRSRGKVEDALSLPIIGTPNRNMDDVCRIAHGEGGNAKIKCVDVSWRDGLPFVGANSYIE